MEKIQDLKSNIDKVISKFNEHEIKQFECAFDLDRLASVYINDIDDYLDLLKMMNINVIFSNIIFYDKEDYIINEKTLEDCNNAITFSEILDKEIKSYNQKIENMDFSIPNGYLCFFVKDNVAYKFIYDNDWIEYDADTALQLIIANHKEELERIKEEEEKEISDLLIKLEDYILEDDAFKRATNKNLRYAYVSKLVRNPKFKPYEKCFMEYGKFSSIGVCNLVEDLWRIYKGRR